MHGCGEVNMGDSGMKKESKRNDGELGQMGISKGTRLCLKRGRRDKRLILKWRYNLNVGTRGLRMYASVEVVFAHVLRILSAADERVKFGYGNMNQRGLQNAKNM